MPFASRAAVAATSLFLLLAASAGAATVTDATGDGGDPGHDITRFDWTYGPAGTATGTITVAGDGGDAGLLMAFSVANADGTCSQTDGAVLVGVKSLTDPSQAQWAQFTGGQAGALRPARRSGSGLSYTVTATDPALAGKGYTCAEAQTTDATNTDVVFDSASPQAAAPTSTPAPAAPTPAPTPGPAAKKPRLKLSVKGLKAVRAGKTTRPVLTVRNAGTATSKQATLRFNTPLGISIRPSRVTVKALKPKQAVSLKLRVTVSRRAKATNPVKATVGAAKLTLAVRRSGIRKAKPKPPAKGGLPGSFWWWNEFTAYTPFNVFSLRFYDNGYAYYRLPDDDQSVPDKCTSVTSVPDKDGEYGPGCVKWALKGSTLTFTDPRFTGTYENGKLSIRDKDDTFKVDRLAQPQAGKRLHFSYQNIESTGICAPFSFCSIQKSYLTLQSDGQFGLTKQSSSSLDTGGGFTYAGSFPPESRGTYEVLGGYRIRLSYANGKTEVVPFGVIDGTSAVDSNVKVVVGRLPYWVPDEND